MHTVWRIEHRDHPCWGPSRLFTLGIYAPTWLTSDQLPSPSFKRPKWVNDDALFMREELWPDYSHANCNGKVHHDWYFAFASLAQLDTWFSLRWRKRNGYLKRGAVIREYRGPRVLFGKFQCAIHHAEAERVGTFHIYRPNERIET